MSHSKTFGVIESVYIVGSTTFSILCDRMQFFRDRYEIAKFEHHRYINTGFNAKSMEFMEFLSRESGAGVAQAV
jgi:hypothetical protein